ncbi:hypothetical protein [Myxacorys almedinensis]|uniref:Uncharacterized protein n=1 Tax=Myxacorys almedinensis A TaxID=2690445 RepID=A0A8J7YZN8_9CYAN|nr:hypothetical protein [Myxacorys almedinensis]NDJ17504.1 hypothetical protein [Myxacorys almedinensis A]
MQSSESRFFTLTSPSIHAQTSVGEPPAERFDSSSTSAFIYDAALLLLPLGFVAMWATVVCVISDTWKLRRNAPSSKQAVQLPCKKCQFFHNNPYIKCAVNPHLALTPEAADCSEFRQRDRKTPSAKGNK